MTRQDAADGPVAPRPDLRLAGVAVGGLIGARVAGGLVGGFAGMIAGFAGIYLRYRDL